MRIHARGRFVKGSGQENFLNFPLDNGQAGVYYGGTTNGTTGGQFVRPRNSAAKQTASIECP